MPISESELAEIVSRPGYSMSPQNRPVANRKARQGNAAPERSEPVRPQAVLSEPRPAIRLSLPYAPSANRYWRNVNGRMVKSAEARKYRDEVGYCFLQQSGLKVKPFEGDVAITLSIFRPQKRGDLDNRLKVVIDALQGLAFLDDAQVSIVHAARFDDKDNPRIEVLISEADHETL